MPLLGAHLSISGGYFRAVEEAAALGMDCVQLFTKNNTQWRAKPLSDDDVALFRDALKRTGIRMPCGHTSYLLNLASPDRALWRKSVDSLVVELQRAEALGLIGLVLHPGSHRGSGEEEGLRRVAEGLKAAIRRTAGFVTPVLLENTAGQGGSLGYRFEHLGRLIDEVAEPDRLGVCFDSCHAFAAGYGLRTARQYERTMEELDRAVGLQWIRAYHLNDSKRPRGSRVDRHERIGGGYLQLASFRRILNDPRFAALPMYLETPKGEEDGVSLDAINLATLRGLFSQRRASGDHNGPVAKKLRSRRRPKPRRKK
ncbi:MAG: deoxyribonuclease IV [Planctomycetes bacterium]|nr:deoxyribonuclease IV [Planctomycetota bacterium]